MVEKAKDIWADGPSGSPVQPYKPHIRAWGTVIEQNSQLTNSPLFYDATGDGTTDDAANYALAEADNSLLYLPVSSVFNLEGERPDKPIYGPGSLKVYSPALSSDVVLDGYNPVSNAVQGNIIWAPDSYAEKVIGQTSTPDSGILNYFNTVVGVGSANASDLSKEVTRSTIYGSAIGQAALNWERVEAYGNGAMRFAMYGDRETAIGTLSLQWLGNNDPGSYFHDFWLEGGKTPSDTDWDAYGLETRNPGNARSGILATTYAIGKADVGGNVGLGRNSLLHQVKGADNVAIGYNAQAHSWSGSFNVAVGARAGRDNLFGVGLVAIGTSAGVSHQQGNNDTFVGQQVASEWVRGGNNVIVGGNAGRNITDGSGNVFIGYASGQNLGVVGSVNNRLAIQNSATSEPLIYGTFSGALVGIGKASPSEVKGTLSVITEAITGAVSTAADDLVVQNNAAGGITILTPNNVVAQIAFADPEGIQQGGVRYDHSTDRIFLYANAAAQMSLGASGYWTMPNVQTTAPAAGSKRVWADPADGGTLKVAL